MNILSLCLSESEFQEESTLSWNESYDFNGLSILLVDDNELNRVVLNELIQNMKQEINLSFAEDGLVAVEMVKERLMDQRTALLKIPAESVDTLLVPIFDARAQKDAVLIGKGLPAGPGAATGRIAFSAAAAGGIDFT